MPRYIDAEKIPYIDLNDDMPQSKIRVYVAFKERIDQIQSADVRENKHGIWVETGFGCECPFCGNEVCMKDEYGEQYKPNYCECCGADMRGDTE